MAAVTSGRSSCHSKTAGTIATNATPDAMVPNAATQAATPIGRVGIRVCLENAYRGKLRMQRALRRKPSSGLIYSAISGKSAT